MAEQVQHAVRDEQAVASGKRLTLNIHAGELSFPAILQLPEASAPVPAALLLHGFSNRKEVMADSVGRALLRRGVASLAIDLPMHGTRGNPFELQSLRNPLEIVRLWRLALREAALSVRFLQGRADIDAGRVAIVGYSLGSFLSLMLAASEPDVGPVVLAAGGDLPAGMPLVQVARAVVDPVRAVQKLGGRPLLMTNGRLDPIIRPEQAQRLFDAAPEPKELRWWNGGHSVPEAMIDDTADWLAARLGAATSFQTRGR